MITLACVSGFDTRRSNCGVDFRNYTLVHFNHASAHERFLLMMKSYLMFDFGKSYFRDVSVIELIKEKLPVSISLGLWMTLIT